MHRSVLPGSFVLGSHPAKPSALTLTARSPSCRHTPPSTPSANLVKLHITSRGPDVVEQGLGIPGDARRPGPSLSPEILPPSGGETGPF